MISQPNQKQVVVALTQTVLPLCVFAIMLASTGGMDHWLSLQTLFLLGTLVSAWGAASALWTRARTTLLLSMLLVVLSNQRTSAFVPAQGTEAKSPFSPAKGGAADKDKAAKEKRKVASIFGGPPKPATGGA